MEKYHQLHGQDVTNYDISGTHRLPTVSAADALAGLEDDEATGFVPTGLPSLDRLLAHVDLDDSETPISGGLPKGQMAEAWGPPGCGKTGLGVQLAANALEAGQNVTWVDAFHPVCRSRLDAALASATRFQEPTWPDSRGGHGDSGDVPSSPVETKTDAFSRFHHFSCPSLAHFVALVCRPTAGSGFAAESSLVVIDSLTALVNQTYPKAPEGRKPGPVSGSSARRLQGIQCIVESLQKLAATRNLAILVLSQCATKVQAESESTLIPAVNTNAWEQAMSTRFVIFKDWIWKGRQPCTVHFIGIQRLNGKQPTAESTVAFGIGSDGLSEIAYDSSQPSVKISTPTRKRKLDEMGLEIPDSQDEEYGWDQDDDDSKIPRTLSPQWKGSEDVLLQPFGVAEDGRTAEIEPQDEGGHSPDSGSG